MPDTCPTVNRGRSSSSNGNDGTVTHSLAQITSKTLAGPVRSNAPGPQGDPLPSGSDLLLAVGVECVAKVETAGKGAGNPLAGDQLLVLTGLLGTLRAHREHAAVHRDVDGLGVHARQVEAELDVVLATDHVHRHGRPHSGPVASAERAPGEAVELTRWVE